MAGKARDSRVVPRDGKGGDGACRRAARVSPCPWGDHEESRATHPQEGDQSLCGAAAVLAAPDLAAQGGTKVMFATKSEAEAAARQFNCKGAHNMGETWMSCQEYPGP